MEIICIQPIFLCLAEYCKLYLLSDREEKRQKLVMNIFHGARPTFFYFISYVLSLSAASFLSAFTHSTIIQRFCFVIQWICVFFLAFVVDTHHLPHMYRTALFLLPMLLKRVKKSHDISIVRLAIWVMYIAAL